MKIKKVTKLLDQEVNLKMENREVAEIVLALAEELEKFWIFP